MLAFTSLPKRFIPKAVLRYEQLSGDYEEIRWRKAPSSYFY